MRLKIEIKPKGEKTPYFLAILCDPPFTTGTGITKQAAIENLILEYKKDKTSELFEVELDEKYNLISIGETNETQENPS